MRTASWVLGAQNGSEWQKPVANPYPIGGANVGESFRKSVSLSGKLAQNDEHGTWRNTHTLGRLKVSPFGEHIFMLSLDGRQLFLWVIKINQMEHPVAPRNNHLFAFFLSHAYTPRHHKNVNNLGHVITMHDHHHSCATFVPSILDQKEGRETILIPFIYNEELKILRKTQWKNHDVWREQENHLISHQVGWRHQASILGIMITIKDNVLIGRACPSSTLEADGEEIFVTNEREKKKKRGIVAVEVGLCTCCCPIMRPSPFQYHLGHSHHNIRELGKWSRSALCEPAMLY